MKESVHIGGEYVTRKNGNLVIVKSSCTQLLFCGTHFIIFHGCVRKLRLVSILTFRKCFWHDRWWTNGLMGYAYENNEWFRLSRRSSFWVRSSLLHNYEYYYHTTSTTFLIILSRNRIQSIACVLCKLQ